MKQSKTIFSIFLALFFISSALVQADTLPARWDWREHNGVTPVQDQGCCGSCWAFAAVATVESAILINDGATANLSEQHLVSCNQSGWGCGGGWVAFPYYCNWQDECSKIGTVEESCFPYTASDAPCSCCSCSRIHELLDWEFIDQHRGIPTNKQMKNYIYYSGPIWVAVDTYNWHLLSLGDGILKEEEFKNDLQGINHAIVIVGWDDNYNGSGTGVWIIKNSWGTWWQDGGFGYVKYGTGQIGDAACWVDYAGGRLNCENAIDLTHHVAYDGTTEGAPSRVDSYSGCGISNETGPEKVHRITAFMSGGDITTTLSDHAPDLDVFILSDCDPDSCLAHASGTGTITATYYNAPAGTYFIVVDGYNDTGGSYSLTADALQPQKNLAVDFGGSGLHVYDWTTWESIAGSNPTMLGTYDSKLVAKFSSGLYEYGSGSFGWSRIATANTEEMLGIGSILYADFGSLGLYMYDGSSWTRIAGSNSSMLAEYNTKLVTRFSSGLYIWAGGSWNKLAGSNAEEVLGVGANLYADFGSLGLHVYYASTWTQIAGSNPTMLGSYSTTLVAKFSTGVYRHNGGTSWTRIATANAEEMLGIGTNLYVDFGASWLHVYNGSGWTQIVGSNPTMLGSCDYQLVAKFSSCLYLHDSSTNWTRLATTNAEDIVECN